MNLLRLAMFFRAGRDETISCDTYRRDARYRLGSTRTVSVLCVGATEESTQSGTEWSPNVASGASTSSVRRSTSNLRWRRICAASVDDGKKRARDGQSVGSVDVVLLRCAPYSTTSTRRMKTRRVGSTRRAAKRKPSALRRGETRRYGFHFKKKRRRGCRRVGSRRRIGRYMYC